MITRTLKRKINFSSVTVDTIVQCMNFEYTVLVSQYSLYQKIDKLKGLASSLKLKSTDDFSQPEVLLLTWTSLKLQPFSQFLFELKMLKCGACKYTNYTKW